MYMCICICMYVYMYMYVFIGVLAPNTLVHRCLRASLRESIISALLCSKALHYARLVYCEHLYRGAHAQAEYMLCSSALHAL